MFNNFNGMCGAVADGMCRLSMSGQIAIKTSNGYKAYNVKTGRLTNCDNFALNTDNLKAFFVIPTNKVAKGGHHSSKRKAEVCTHSREGQD